MTDRPVVIPDTVYWNPRQARYQDARGRIISRDKVLALVEQRISDGIEDVLEDYLAAMLNGAPVSDWQSAMATELKRSFLQSFAAGKGGFEAMSQADYGLVGAKLREQYKYLRNFAQEIASGSLSEREIRRRMAMYENASRTMYYAGYRSAERRAGRQFERRLLTAAEHCGGCIDLFLRGWQPIGTLPLIADGSTPCLTNDRCYFEFSNEKRTDFDMDTIQAEWDAVQQGKVSMEEFNTFLADMKVFK